MQLQCSCLGHLCGPRCLSTTLSTSFRFPLLFAFLPDDAAAAHTHARTHARSNANSDIQEADQYTARWLRGLCTTHTHTCASSYGLSPDHSHRPTKPTPPNILFSGATCPPSQPTPHCPSHLLDGREVGPGEAAYHADVGGNLPPAQHVEPLGLAHLLEQPSRLCHTLFILWQEEHGYPVEHRRPVSVGVSRRQQEPADVTER